MACPPRSIYKQQSLVLRELKSHPGLAALNHVAFVRITDLTGRTLEEENLRLPAAQPSSNDECSVAPGASASAGAPLKAGTKAAGAKKDSLPCRVAEGLFIGGAAAARNLKALRKRGITHIVNASPSVPCHFKDNPEGCFSYLPLELFDDADAELLPHIAAANAFISAARSQGGVLVHCYAGQSRSAALVMAYLMSQGQSFMEAWAATRRARPCAQPNSGFLRQLALYNKQLTRSLSSQELLNGLDCQSGEAGLELGLGLASPASSPEDATLLTC